MLSPTRPMPWPKPSRAGWREVADQIGAHSRIAVVDVAEGWIVVGAGGAARHPLLKVAALGGGGGRQAGFGAAEGLIAAADRQRAPGGVSEIGPAGVAIAMVEHQVGDRLGLVAHDRVPAALAIARQQPMPVRLPVEALQHHPSIGQAGLALGGGPGERSGGLWGSRGGWRGREGQGGHRQLFPGACWRYGDGGAQQCLSEGEHPGSQAKSGHAAAAGRGRRIARGWPGPTAKWSGGDPRGGRNAAPRAHTHRGRSRADQPGGVSGGASSGTAELRSGSIVSKGAVMGWSGP